MHLQFIFKEHLEPNGWKNIQYHMKGGASAIQEPFLPILKLPLS